MKFTIEFETNNAAFETNPDQEFRRISAYIERVTGVMFTNRYSGGKKFALVQDIDGNKIGLITGEK